MSVRLFAKEEVYQELADAYEDLKHIVMYRYDGDEKFYQTLRRLYFANVATFLCQYHDDTPLPKEELSAVDPFMELEGKRNLERSLLESLHSFLSAWRLLRYNLVTNDGEMYIAKSSYEYLDDLAQLFSREVAEREAERLSTVGS
jgi:hypothetical protein